MEVSIILCVFVGMFLSPADGHVLNHFRDSNDCLKFFYKEKVPVFGASLPDLVSICQCLKNKYHFATLYNTSSRIPVYSAYIFEKSSGDKRQKNYFVEPQLVNLTWFSEMEDGHQLSLLNQGVYIGEKQAVHEDYLEIQPWSRGHLNPHFHHKGKTNGPVLFKLPENMSVLGSVGLKWCFLNQIAFIDRVARKRRNKANVTFPQSFQAKEKTKMLMLRITDPRSENDAIYIHGSLKRQWLLTAVGTELFVC